MRPYCKVFNVLFISIWKKWFSDPNSILHMNEIWCITTCPAHSAAPACTCDTGGNTSPALPQTHTSSAGDSPAQTEKTSCHFKPYSMLCKHRLHFICLHEDFRYLHRVFWTMFWNAILWTSKHAFWRVIKKAFKPILTMRVISLKWLVYIMLYYSKLRF